MNIQYLKMARALLFSFFVVFSFGLNAQNFHEKYDIDGFFELADFNQLKKTFKKFKAHLESRDIQFDNRFREEFENELVNYSDAMNFYHRYKKLNKNRKLLGILTFPASYLGTYLVTITTNSIASVIIFSPESSSLGLDPHIQALKAAGITTALTLPFAIIPSKSEIATFFDALLIYHTAFKKQNDSSLLSQNFYKKYDIANFIHSTNLLTEKEAFKAFKDHLMKYNKSFDESFRNEYKSTLGFSNRIPDFPLAMAYYRVSEQKKKLIVPSIIVTGILSPILINRLITMRNVQFINSLKAYHTKMGLKSFKKSDSPWEQNPKRENPWD